MIGQSARPHCIPRGARVLTAPVLLLTGCFLTGCDLPAEPGQQVPDRGENGPAAVTLRLDTLELGLEQPLFATFAPDDSRRLFVVEKTGRIRIRLAGRMLGTPFLDLSALVSTNSERGLLGLAFHPNYQANGLFYVNYTALGGDTHVVEYQRGGSPNVANPGSARVLLTVDQPAANHNGGMMAFGPDGYLYIALGDGGGTHRDNAQDMGTLLGKILRIDVDGGLPYAIPPDNPFVDVEGARPEIYHLGLRNPWRFSFDRKWGHMYVADVGQNTYEEVNVVGWRAGLNFGWPIMEGPSCFLAETCARRGLRLPDYWYTHDNGCSVTGGYVYRGRDIPELRGTYLFADLCNGGVRSFRRPFGGGDVTEITNWTAQTGDPGRITSFGESERGEVFMTTIEGGLYKVVAGS